MPETMTIAANLYRDLGALAFLIVVGALSFAYLVMRIVKAQDKISATLDRDDAAPVPGTALPALWHWLYFLPQHRQSEIGPDGASTSTNSGAGVATPVGGSNFNSGSAFTFGR